MSIPKWGDLLVSMDMFPSGFSKQPLSEEQVEQLERIANASDGFNGTLTSGISAIGWALAAAADNDSFGLDSSEILSLGWLIHSLGDLSQQLSDIHSDARHKLQHCPRAKVQEAQQ